MHGRFDEEEMISDFLTENSAARGAPTRCAAGGGEPEERIRLGEMISQGVELRREAENRALIDTLTPCAVAHAPRPPSNDWTR